MEPTARTQTADMRLTCINRGLREGGAVAAFDHPATLDPSLRDRRPNGRVERSRMVKGKKNPAHKGPGELCEQRTHP